MALPQQLIDRIDVLRGQTSTVTELTGGLTNRNYKVTTGSGSYVVRVASPSSSALAVNREHEYRNSVLAAAAGVGAPVIAYLPDEAVLVIGFLEGTVLTDDSFAQPGMVERAAAACRRLHAGPRFVNDFNMFDIQAGYLRIVLERGYRLPAGYLDHQRAVDRIEAAMGARPHPTVPCNNDLLAANFIDGGDQLYLIDYEYSGNNDPCFELGNIWSECHLCDDQLEELVDAYYGGHVPTRVARARLQALMSQYGWTLWASIQDATSDIAFDFWEWGMEKYERAQRMFDSPELGRLVDLVASGD